MAGSVSLSALAQADRGNILNVMATFSGTAPECLRIGHPAAGGRLPGEWDLVHGISAADLVEAVALSAPNHCIDAWTFLARSLQALSSGDFHSARHLAYYSQLRAALSMLANLGIGVFNGINFVVTSSGNVRRLDPATVRRRGGTQEAPRGLGTHSVVWDTLHLWVSQMNPTASFLDLLSVAGTPLGDALEALVPGARNAVTATMLLNSWGLDLRRAKIERGFRNTSSYQPHLLNVIDESAEECVNYLNDFWSSLEPAGSRGFELLDRHLFRNLLWDLHRVTSPEVPLSSSVLVTNYEFLQPQLQTFMSLPFLLGEEEADELSVVSYARSRRDPATALEMVSRGLILSRAATGFTRSSLTQAGSPDVSPWFEGLALSRGFVPPGVPLESPLDLWLDVQAALGDLRATRVEPFESLNAWLNAPVTGLPILTQAERISVWALA